jgi:hypothetical protein
MLASTTKRLIDDYLGWLREGYRVEPGEGHTVISTPFLDPHNDEIQIFVEALPDERLRLSDDGYTLADLQDLGLEINTPKREAQLQQILNGFGVRVEDGELAVTASPRDFPQRKHSLLQAILAVHDLVVMGQAQVLSFFEEDVARFLKESHVPFIRGIKFSGRSGFDHHFVFAFPSMADRPDSVLHPANVLTRDLATSIAFAVNDVRLQRGKNAFEARVIINDQEQSPSSDHLDALRAYAIKPTLWSRRQALAEELISS